MGYRSEGEDSEGGKRGELKRGRGGVEKTGEKGLMNAMQHPVGLVETTAPIMVDCNEPFAKFCGFVFPPLPFYFILLVLFFPLVFLFCFLYYIYNNIFIFDYLITFWF